MKDPNINPGLAEHKLCRQQEFRRWTRVVLEHEREHLSRSMVELKAVLSEDAKELTLHEITDIDVILAHLGSIGE